MARETDPGLQRAQIAEQRRKVDFDTYDVTVDELIRRVGKSRIDIAPSYQRQFRWREDRQSRLVESLLLGIPIPPLFMATNTVAGAESQWEVVDGLQRLLTMVNFAGDPEARAKVNLPDLPLKLCELEKLHHLNKCNYGDLPADIRSSFEDRPMKVIVLNDKSDLTVRYDLFERLNTGGLALTDQEVRECVFRGPFIDLLVDLAGQDNFKSVVVLPQNSWRDGTPQEYILRFFAFLEEYPSFDHSVKDFLTDYTKSVAPDAVTDDRRQVFNQTFDFMHHVFPNGVKTRKGMTPVNLFEALSVGAALALRQVPNLSPLPDPSWVATEDLKKLTTGATNSRSRVAGRIEYCRDHFLAPHV